MGRRKKQTRGAPTSGLTGGVFIQEQLNRNGKKMENLTEESIVNIWKEMNPRVRTVSLCAG